MVRGSPRSGTDAIAEADTLPELDPLPEPVEGTRARAIGGRALLQA